MKKVLMLFLAMGLLVGCISFTAIEAKAATVDSGTCGANLTWTLDDQGTLTISGTGNMTNYSNYGAPWFNTDTYRGSLKQVIIESGVTSIGNSAFYSLKGLTEISIPSTVTKIGESAFGYCESLQEIVIPEGVRMIQKYTFTNCVSLTTVVIPKSVQSFGAMAFDRCSSLEYLIIPEGVTELPQSMFEDCTSLEYVSIPTSVTYIHTHAFDNCGNLWDIYYAGTQTQFEQIGVYNLGNDQLSKATIHYSSKAPCRNHAYGNCASVSDTQHSRTCANCGYVETVSHTWNSGSVIKEATCKETGAKTYTCTGCNATKTEDIAKTNDHKYGGWTTVNNTTHKHACSVCSKEETANHEWDSGKVTKEATCKEDGSKTYTCTVCKETKTESIKAIGHSYTNHVTAPTCTDQGYTSHTCSVCNDSYKDSYVDAKGHNYTSKVTAPTCTDQGYTTYTCTVCGNSYAADYVSPNGHTETIDAEKTATCTESGLTAGKHCAVCQSVLVEQNVVPAQGHTDGNTDLVCDVCKVCISHVEEVIPNTAATCTQSGLTDGKKCSNCDKILQAQEIIPALGHNYGEWAQVKAPTTTETGQEERVCSNCNNKEQRELSKLEPTPTEPQATTPTKDPHDNDGDATLIIVCTAIGGLGIGGAAVLIVLKKKK